MKRLKKRIAIFLVAAMVSSSMPVKVFAERMPAAEMKDIQATEAATKKQQKKEPKILKEIVEKREEYSKTFLRNNMTYEAVIYSKPVHYLENGEWKDIDNSLMEASSNMDSENPNDESEFGSGTEEEGTKDAFENKANDFKVKIAKNSSSSKLVSVKKNDYEISWNLPEANEVKANKIDTDTKAIDASIEKAVDEEMAGDLKLKAATEEEKADIRSTRIENEKKKTLYSVNSKVEFAEILSNVDLEYQIKGTEVKENIVINERIENPEFKFNLKVKNLVPKLDKDNVITFYDKLQNDKAIYTINAPYMVDGKYEDSNKIKVTLNETAEGYELILTPDKEWLDKEERTYPVIVDPNVTTALGIKEIQDTFICSNDPENKYVNEYLRVGNNSGVGITRSYMKFTLPTLKAGDMVTEAYLGLTYCLPGNVGGQINLHKVNSDWTSQGISWSYNPGYDSKIQDYQIINGQPLEWDVSSVVKEWYSTGNNYGLMLKNENENQVDTKFTSSDNYDVSIRPRVTIRYVNCTGLENYWTYHSMSAGRAGTAYVNDYNGNLVYIHNDLSMNGNLMPVQINHVYNSTEAKAWDRTKPWMGAGWTLNIYQHIETFETNLEKYLVFVDGDGTKIYFKYTDINAVSNITDELNLGYTITKESSGYYTLKDKNYNKTTFYGDGSLLSVTDKNGNTLTAKYTQASNGIWTITALEDGAKRTTTLVYDNNGILLRIIDPAQRITYFDYDTTSYQKLEKVTYPDGKYTIYEYDLYYNLLGAINHDGIKNRFEYSSYAPYRVKRVLNTHINGTNGEELNISYGNNSTIFTQPPTSTRTNEIKETYLFDNWGKVVSVRDGNNSAVNCNYSTESNITKVGSESKLRRSTSNFLLNHNFEEDRNWNASDSVNAVYTTEEKYSGAKALKITSSSTSNVIYREQYMKVGSNKTKLEKGKTYTLSAFIKTKDIEVNTSGEGGAALVVAFKKADGSWTYQYKYVKETTDWRREELTFTVPSDVSYDVWCAVEMKGAKGTAYFDCLQLEEGSAASRYNLIEDGDFKYYYDQANNWYPLWWTKNYDCEQGDYVDGSYENHPDNLDNDVLKLNGYANKNKGVYQNVKASGKKDDTFVVSAWAKADSVPSNAQRAYLFEINVGFVKPNGGGTVWKTVPFNTDINQWQYLSSAVIAPEDYVDVQVYLCYYKNANAAYFDGIELYKEEFGTSFTYDGKGNVISTESLAKQKSKFDYAENDLIKYTDPKGSEFSYTYFGNHNIDTATTAENVKYSFIYDAKGNPTRSRVAGGSIFSEAYADYSDSGNYVETITDSSGNKVNYSFNETKGTLDNVTDGKGTTTSYQYDPNLDRLLNVKKTVDGKEIANSYIYKDDRLDTITHYGASYGFGYDSLGNNTTVSVGNKNLVTNSYTTRTSLLKKSVYGNSQSIENIYDSLDRVIGKKLDGKATASFTYAYDNEGNLSGHEDTVNNVKYKYSYDLSDRLTKVSDDKGNLLNYSFDLNNNVSAVKETLKSAAGVQNYSTHYGYDKDNRPISVMFSRGGASSNLDASLLAYYTFDNGDATDSSGNGHNGIIHGSPTFVKSDRGKAIKLSAAAAGQEQWVDLSEFGVPESFSVSLWIKPDTIVNNQCFLGKHTNNGDNIFIMGYWNNGYEVGVRNGWYASCGTEAKTADYQHLVAVVKKVDATKSHVTVYKNNKEVWNQDINGVIGSTDGKGWALGQDWDSSTVSDLFKGEIDEVAIYNRDLTAVEVGDLYGNKSTVSNLYDAIGRVTHKTISIGEKTYTTEYGYLSGISGTTTKIGYIDNNKNKITYSYDKNGNIETVTEAGKTTRYSYNELNELVKEEAYTSDGVIAYYNFNNGDVTDNSGNGNNGKVYGSTKFTDVANRGKVIEFNGTTDWAELKDFAVPESFTVSMWVNPATTTMGQSFLGKHTGEGENQFLLGLWVSGYNITVKDKAYATASGTATTGFQHITAVVKKNSDTESQVKIYKNGTLIANTTVAAALGGTAGKPWVLGQEWDQANLSNFFKGSIDDLAIFDHDLNDTEVQSVFTNGVKLSKRASIVYSYDQGGNITSKTKYNEAGQVEKTDAYEYGDVNWKDKLTKYVVKDGSGTILKSEDLKYDLDEDSNSATNSIGNPSKIGTWDFVWECGRQLKSMKNTTNSIEFKYNDGGIRTEKVIRDKDNNPISTTSYHLVGSKVTYEENNTDKIYYTYDASSKLVSMNLTCTTNSAINGDYYYIRNAQGDIIGLIDKNGAQVVSYSYDSWGKLISTTGTLAATVGEKNPYRYRGYRYDTETALYYLQSRYYNPEFGRFINADALGGKVGELLSHNVFAYCQNDPVNFYDPNGFTKQKWYDEGGRYGYGAPAQGKVYKETHTAPPQWANQFAPDEDPVLGPNNIFKQGTHYIIKNTCKVVKESKFEIAVTVFTEGTGVFIFAFTKGKKVLPRAAINAGILKGFDSTVGKIIIDPNSIIDDYFDGDKLNEKIDECEKYLHEKIGGCGY